MTPPRPRERGIALLLVLWIFMILGVLALDFARYIRDDAMAAVNLSDETRGYYLALAGFNRAIFDAERAREAGPGSQTAAAESVRRAGKQMLEEEVEGPLVPIDGEWHEADLGDGRFSVRMVDEGSKIPVNAADEILLTRVVTSILQQGNATTGLDKRANDQVATVVDSILDWRDNDGDDLVRVHGAESDYYLGLAVPYPAKNARFDSPEELLVVRGVTPEIFYGTEIFPGLRDIVTVHQRKVRQVNLRTTTAAVIQVMLGVDALTAEDLLAQRDTDPDTTAQILNGQLSAINPALGDFFVDVEPSIVTIEAKADVKEPRNQSHVAAVVDLAGEDAEGARIRQWLDRAPWAGPMPSGGAHGGAIS